MVHCTALLLNNTWMMTFMMCNVDDSTDKRLEDEVQRCRDLLDEANRQISSMSHSVR